MSQLKRKASSESEANKLHDLADSPSPSLSPSLSENIQEQIGAKLKALFDESVNQPVPDRFVELLQALAEKEDGADADRSELP
jgi:hypothetical protein